MARKQAYNEPTKMFSCRVPESKFEQVGVLVRKFLNEIKPPEVKPIEMSKGVKGGIVVNLDLTKTKPCDCYLDERGLFRRGKSGCKMIKQEHKFS